MLDLRLLHYFVAVAETEHVGRAAVRLHISQSPLSRQIQRLERELGLSLFERERKRVRLTDAGRWLLVEARSLLGQAATLERDVQRLSSGETGRVAVACVKTALWSDVLQRALRALRKEHPALRIDVDAMSSDAQIEALLAGRVDLAIVHRKPTVRGVVSREILREPFRLAVPRTHRLAVTKHIAPADLSSENWVLLTRSLAPESHDRFLDACARLGVTIRSSSETRDRATQLALVEAGLGIALVPDSAKRIASDDVVLREVAWLGMTSSLHVVRRKVAPSRGAAALLAMLANGAREESESR
jgi:DNA-binding transcriptional LysR family regulator